MSLTLRTASSVTSRQSSVTATSARRHLGTSAQKNHWPLSIVPPNWLPRAARAWTLAHPWWSRSAEAAAVLALAAGASVLGLAAVPLLAAGGVTIVTADNSYLPCAAEPWRALTLAPESEDQLRDRVARGEFAALAKLLDAASPSVAQVLRWLDAEWKNSPAEAGKFIGGMSAMVEAARTPRWVYDFSSMLRCFAGRASAWYLNPDAYELPQGDDRKARARAVLPTLLHCTKYEDLLPASDYLSVLEAALWNADPSWNERTAAKEFPPFDAEGLAFFHTCLPELGACVQGETAELARPPRRSSDERNLTAAQQVARWLAQLAESRDELRALVATACDVAPEFIGHAYRTAMAARTLAEEQWKQLPAHIAARGDPAHVVQLLVDADCLQGHHLWQVLLDADVHAQHVKSGRNSYRVVSADRVEYIRTIIAALPTALTTTNTAIETASLVAFLIGAYFHAPSLREDIQRAAAAMDAELQARLAGGNSFATNAAATIRVLRDQALSAELTAAPSYTHAIVWDVQSPHSVIPREDRRALPLGLDPLFRISRRFGRWCGRLFWRWFGAP